MRVVGIIGAALLATLSSGGKIYPDKIYLDYTGLMKLNDE